LRHVHCLLFLCAEPPPLSFIGHSGVTAASMLGARAAFAAGAAASVTPDEALARLKAGNEKYVAAPQVCAGDLLKHREDVAKGQTPRAAILTCSDSRVPAELLFSGLGVGELARLYLLKPFAILGSAVIVSVPNAGQLGRG
jgi:hypothetical protein